MKTKTAPSEWLFDVEKAPLFASIMDGNGKSRQVPAANRIAIVDRVSGDVVGVVSRGYRLFTNRDALALSLRFCREAFPDTSADEWEFRQAHGPESRSWVAMDLFHRSFSINVGRLFTESFTPFVRVTNSYNASRAVRLDVGFMRGLCSNGMIFTEEAAKILASHTDEGIRRLQFSRPFDGMAELVKQFEDAVSDVRSIDVTPEQGAEITRRVIRWPSLPKDPTPAQMDDQWQLDADLAQRRDRYFGELGANAYAVFNIVTDFASHPPESSRMRRDRPAMERMAGAWLRRVRTAALRPGFTIAGHIAELGDDGAPS